MLIRSQNRMRIANLNNAQGLRVEQPSLQASWGVYVDGIRMGEYSSKTKALKVLEQIQNTWRQYGMEQRTIYLPGDEEVEE